MTWIVLVLLIFSACVREHRSQTIANTPITVNVFEEEKAQIVLTDIVCSHTSTIRVDLSFIFPFGPCGSCFAVFRAAPSPNFQLFFLPSQGNLSYSVTPIYNVTVTCTDDITSTATAVNVRVRPNEPPIFGSFSDTVTGLNAQTTLNGAVIYTVTDATDPDGDTVFYTLTVSPASSAGKYEIGRTDGKIRAKENLASECFPTVVFFIYINDNRNRVVGPKVITLQFSTYYTVPYISVLNKEILVSEDTAIGDTVGPADITATHNSASVSYTLETFPLTAAYLFEIPSIGTPRLRLRNKLNFESFMQTINITVKPTNNFCSPDIFYLYVRVIDANDPPVIFPRDISILQNEGAVSFDPGFTYTEEDVSDTVFYSIVAGNIGNMFAINHLTGVITSSVYNIDQLANPIQVVLTVQVQDVKGPDTDNTTVTINFLDINDNPPVIAAAAYAANVEDCTIVGSILGTVVAADTIDTAYDGNNVVECVPNSNTHLTVLSTCAVILSSPIAANNVSILYVTARDLGTVPGPLTSAAVPFVVTSLPCTTSTTVTPPSTTVTTTTTPTTTTGTTTVAGIDSLIPPNAVNGDDGGTSNIWWIVIGCILGCICLAVAAFVISRYVIPRCRGKQPEPFRPGSGINNKTSPANRQRNQQGSNTHRNAQRPVTLKEV